MKSRVLWLSLAMWVLTGLPTLAGYLAAGPDREHAARITIVAADTTAYYSNIEQARQGRWLFANQFTSEPQRPSLFHPLWLVTGWVANLVHLATPLAYQLVRLLAIGCFVWLLDRIVRSMWLERRAQWIALLLVLTSSGLGWLISFGDQTSLHRVPPDRWVAESNTFASLGHSALFIGSQALLVLWLWTFWRWSVGQLQRLPWWLGLAGGALMIIHPYDVVTLAAVVAVWTAGCFWKHLWTRAHLRAAVGLGAQLLIWAAVVAAYYKFVVLSEPAMSGWLAQNIDVTPNPVIVLLGYGLLLPLALWGFVRLRHRPVTIWLATWAAVHFLATYAPIDFQRRLLSGLHIPIALLAAQGLIDYSRTAVPVRLRGWLVAGMLFVLAITNGKSLVTDVAIQLVPTSVNFPVYMTQDEATAMEYLKLQTDFQDVIFSEVWMGNTIPGVAGRTVVVGHGHQTLHLRARLLDWLAFTKNELSDQQRSQMLETLRVTWLFWRAQDERPDGYRPDQDPRWRLQYQNATVQLYQLQLNRPE